MMRPAAAIGLLGGKANPYPIVDADDPLAASFRDMFAGYTHAPDGKWAGVVVLMKPGADHAHVIREVRAIAEAVCGPAEKLSLVGEPVLIVEGLKLLADDGRRLSWIVIGLLSVTLLVLLRRLRWVVAILIAVFWSRWLTHAFLKMMGCK